MFKKRKGITLIELIVTIAIFSIVIVAIMNLFVFNNKVYSRSEKLSQVQFDVRMASDYITNELRNKTDISTTDSTMTSSIDLSSLQAKYSSVKSVSFSISKEGDKYIVNYVISGSDPNGDNLYTLDTDVLLNNIKNTTESTGPTIYYK